eukprot:scaffold6052_cov118-Cylindrotheca_fusiformis.AAC.23
MTRNRGFTEAVPLSLSSMAHMTLPLEDGVSDGLTQVLNHLLLSCVNYARSVMPPYNWSARDLTTSPHAWEPHQGDSEPRDLPTSLTKHGFEYQYHRSAFIYLRNAMNKGVTKEEELEYLKNWAQQEDSGILGRITLLFATTGLMTPGELNGTETDDDTPKCVLYKVILEYRSLPATGNKAAVQAEELSMLSFGGSVDDEVKYGALASLYDEIAKYILEIYSVRGKKYKFDLMSSTLCDGTVPRLPAQKGGPKDDTGHGDDPFLKSLCVTVTDHATSRQEEQKYALTRIHLTLEGDLRVSLNQIPSDSSYISNKVQETFLYLKHSPPEMAVGTPSGHTLLLDPKEAGKIYINGRYVTTWGKDPKIGSHFPALFGMDLHSVPYWHGRIFDYDVLKRSYAQLWQDVLIDAKLKPQDIGGRLLSRLVTGRDPVKEDEDDDDDNEMDEEEEEPSSADTGTDCLESQVMQSVKYDPVGISAKALATRFAKEYCMEGFPCLAHEIDWVKSRLPGRVPVVVPLRVINVLRRGGYFDAKRTSDEVWFSQSRPAKEGEETQIVQKAVELLNAAGCKDVSQSTIVFFSGEGITEPVQMKGLVRFNRTLRQYHVNECFSTMSLSDIVRGSNREEEPESKRLKSDNVGARGYLLGFHVAQEHPDGSVLIRYLLKHRNLSI